MTSTLLKPRYFRIADTASFLAKENSSGMWLGIGTAELDNPAVQAVFEHNDPEVIARGHQGFWLQEEWMRRVADYEASFSECEAGSYPWDVWQARALENGVAEDLAALGRSLMREAINHGWCDTLQHECGVPLERFGLETHHTEPPGFRMILGALDDPDHYRARWRWLLETDGLRRHEDREFSPDDPAWTSLWIDWEDENFPISNPASEAAYRREAYRYVAEFHELDQLAQIDIDDVAFVGTADGPLYAAYTVLECVWRESTGTWTFYPRLQHRGLIRVKPAPAGSSCLFDSELYQQRDEE